MKPTQDNQAVILTLFPDEDEEFRQLAHLIIPLAQQDYTLCGCLIDEEEERLTGKAVTCPDCLEVIQACKEYKPERKRRKNKKVKPESIKEPLTEPESIKEPLTEVAEPEPECREYWGKEKNKTKKKHRIPIKGSPEYWLLIDQKLWIVGCIDSYGAMHSELIEADSSGYCPHHDDLWPHIHSNHWRWFGSDQGLRSIRGDVDRENWDKIREHLDKYYGFEFFFTEELTWKFFKRKREEAEEQLGENKVNELEEI